ncbi:MAG: nucleoid occlusion factor SlmA [Gammaproteobacteria bacterium]|nr:nucleoid occlusion factor SlmA [Gammaproteobacteria bacterium]
MNTTRPNRRQQILETLARELETNPGTRITTASLARAVGVSEAALYRHFASKAKMFEALIDFAEGSVFGLINTILSQEKNAISRCEKIAQLLLGFSERNPGITRVLLGDALVGENERLRVRVAQFFERLETQFKQVLREANLSNDTRAVATIDATANQFLVIIEGKMSQYARSAFEKKPTAYWEEQWAILKKSLFR